MDGWNTYVASMPPEARTDPRLGGRQVRVPQLRIVSANRGVSDANAKIFNQLAILTAIFGIVLIIVCVNLANLLLSRAAARRKEITVRLAIGASRWRVIRQLLTESVLVALIGGAFGLLFAVWCTRLLSDIVFRTGNLEAYPYRVPDLNSTVLVFSAVLTIVTGVVFGIVPALRSTQLDWAQDMRGAENRVTRSGSRLSKCLLIAQVALSLVLLIGASLLVRTFWNLRHIDLGFNPNNIASFRIQPAGYDRSRATALFEQIEQRLLAVPGVRSVSFATPRRSPFV